MNINKKLSNRIGLYVLAGVGPFFSIIGAFLYLSDSAHRNNAGYLQTLGVVALVTAVGWLIYNTLCRKIADWQRWALANGGKYHQLDDNIGIVDELRGTEPGTSQQFILRRVIYSPVMGQGAGSTFARVVLLRADPNNTELSYEIKSKYIWYRVPSVERMLKYFK